MTPTRPSPDTGAAPSAAPRHWAVVARWVAGAVAIATVSATAMADQGPTLATRALAVAAIVVAVLSVLAVRPVAARRLGAWTGSALVVITGATVMAALALASPDCPGGSAGRCTPEETAAWWFNGALVVVVVLAGRMGVVLTSGGARRLGRRLVPLGRRAARSGREVLVDAATRSDGLFLRPPWRDPLLAVGAAVATAAATTWWLLDGDVAAAILAALAGFVAGGVLPAAWRLPQRRPDVVAANRRRAEGSRRRTKR
jgi:hypothetical protein